MEGVEARLLALDSNTAMGPDGIHPLVLKNCAKQLANPLSIIFNRSLGEGLVPNAWKRSVLPHKGKNDYVAFKKTRRNHFCLCAAEW